MGDLYYSFPDDTTATLIGCDLDYNGDVIVPSEIEGHTLTTIENSAFRYCSLVTSISLPETVTSIGEYAFCECSSLTSINIPDSITSIPIGCFRECKSLVSVDFNNVTEVQDFAFAECSNFNMTIPNTITSVGERAFHHSRLTDLHIHDNLTTIGDGAFCWCPLETLTIDENNANYIIEDDVLYNTAKTEIILYPPFKTDTVFSIPETVTRINRYAFEENHYMEKIRINYNIETLDGLGGLMNIRDFECYKGEEVVSTTKNGFMIKQNQVSKKNYLMYRNSALYRVPVDESILVSGNIAEYNIEGLENFPIQGSSNYVYIDTTTSLYYYWNGTSYTQFEYSSLSTGISFSACHHGTFSNCEYLTSLPYEIPCCVILDSYGNSSIGYKCFYKCKNLFENNNTHNTPVVVRLYGTEHIVYDYAFAECNNLKQLIVKKFGNSNYPLTINPYAFYNCTNLNEIQLSGGYNKSIGINSHAFENCISLNNISYYDSSNIITDIMLSEKYGFKNVLNSQNTISCEAFNNVILGCFGYKIITPVSDDYTLFKIYQTQPNVVSIVLGEGMNRIIGDMFRNVPNSPWTKLKYIKFPSTLTEIGSYAFFDTNLDMANVDFSECNNIISIEPYAFWEVKNLNISLTNVQYIGYCAFYETSINNDINIDINNSDASVVFESQAFYRSSQPNSNIFNINIKCNSVAFGEQYFTSRTYVSYTNDGNYTISTTPYTSNDTGYVFYESTVTNVNISCTNLTIKGYGLFYGYNNSRLETLHIYAENQTFGEGNQQMCSYCDKLKHVTVSGKVFAYDFRECNNLETVKFYKMKSPESIADIDSFYTYPSMSKIKELDFSESGLTNIDLSYKGSVGYDSLGEGEFGSLKTLKLPDNLTTLTLSGHGLKGSNVELPESLTDLTITPPCYALTELKIPKNVKSITFGGKTSSYPTNYDTLFIRRLYIPQGCTVTNGVAFGCIPVKITYY